MNARYSLLKTLVLGIYIANKVDGENCSEYTVAARQEEFLRDRNLTFVCTHNSSTATLLKWDLSTSINGITGYINAVSTYASPKYRHLMFIVNEPVLEGNVFTDWQNTSTTNVLTVFNASVLDGFSALSCKVLGPGCLIRPSEISPIVPIVLTDPEFKEVRVQTGPRGDCKTDVICYAISDPMSQLSFSNLDTPEASCVRVAGEPPQPWNCSITSTVTQDTQVSCTATFMDIENTDSTFVQVASEEDCNARSSTDTPGGSEGSKTTTGYAPGGSEGSKTTTGYAAHSCGNMIDLEQMMGVVWSVWVAGCLVCLLQ